MTPFLALAFIIIAAFWLLIKVCYVDVVGHWPTFKEIVDYHEEKEVRDDEV